MLSSRPAAEADLPAIVSLTRAQRQQLARWSPVYFNPRNGADDAHAGYLAFVVGSADHDPVVAVEGNDLVAFYVRIPQAGHTWIDDLCTTDPNRWLEVVQLIAETTSPPWVTCVSAHDRQRRQAMAAIGLSEVSAYHVRSTTDITPHRDLAATTIPDVGTVQRPHHTFGGRAFAPATPGALVVIDTDGGYAIGSPSVSPPIYDPGGSSCVIDQIVGRDRAALLDDALRAATARGDAQVIVVCGREDDELSTIADHRGFTAEVVLIGVLRAPRRSGGHLQSGV